jgi:K+-transporting ATPase KdpF subunit
MTELLTGKGDRIMSVLLWISGIVTLVLLIYLFIALLKPEKFQ